MVPGMPNPYLMTPLKKMFVCPVKIVGSMPLPNLTKAMPVLYNPKSYRMSRTLIMGKSREEATSSEQQFPPTCYMETLQVDLFFDTFNAGADIAGLVPMAIAGKMAMDALKFTGNSLLPSYTKQLDVSTYVNRFYDLCKPDASDHKPPTVALVWGDLEFGAILQSCSVEYVKFKETGVPVRAIAHCTFFGLQALNSMKAANPFGSPDTSKFHTLQHGETLNTVSEIAYDNPNDWREIARANGITNPRLLKTGTVLHMPAIVD